MSATMSPSPSPHFHSRGAWFLMVLAFLSCAILFVRATNSTNVYSTGFEKTEGYNPVLELAGQKGWVKDTSSTGGNGLRANFLGSQGGYVGLIPLKPTADVIYVWQPIDFFAVQDGFPIVNFSVSMAIDDSSNGQWDNFDWSVFNAQGDKLFSIDFDNYALEVNYALDDTNGFIFSGLTFATNAPYTLNLTMDFAHNTWGATLSGLTVATNLPITTTGAPLNLGDIDAVWGIYYTNAPGNNFMVFDNYTITASPAPSPLPPQLTSLGMGPNGEFLLHLAGSSGFQFAIDATTNFSQWTPLKTNVVTGGSFDFFDNAAPGFPTRFYRARFVP
ncbi:MAG TPA: hypothetical protein VG146_03225 [Verrucomicrobiae bacterium]|nr:hypothetical protein [Verrucomicrobiae bacterium]